MIGITIITMMMVTRRIRKIMNSKNLRQKMIKEQTQKFNKIISGKELWRNLEDII